MNDEIKAGIEAIEASMRQAEQSCDAYYIAHSIDNELDSFKYYVERAYVELLVLLDKLELKATYKTVFKQHKAAKKEGFGKTASYEGEIYSHWIAQLRMIVDSVASAHGLRKTSESELRDLKAALKLSVYSICDSNIFPAPPKNEAEVHSRIEAMLKVAYPDLRTKPALNKPIKNFEPDTGLPSARTLIEYKFISTLTDAKRVADEILADASGYRSKDWSNLLFVIYEVNRVQPEEKWQELLRECHLHDGYDAIVLSGVASGKKT